MTQALPMLDANLTLADDLLETVGDFAEFIFGNRQPETIRKTRHLIDIEVVPAEKKGGKYYGLKSTVTRAFRTPAALQAAVVDTKQTVERSPTTAPSAPPRRGRPRRTAR